MSRIQLENRAVRPVKVYPSKKFKLEFTYSWTYTKIISYTHEHLFESKEDALVFADRVMEHGSIDPKHWRRSEVRDNT